MLSFVFDIDGTIAFDGKPVSAAIETALVAILDAGHELIFASARPHRDIKPMLSARFHHQPMVVSNGAGIHQDGRMQHVQALDKDWVDGLLNRFEAAQIPYLLDSDQGFYIGNSQHPFLDYVLTMGTPPSVNRAAFLQDPPIKLLVLGDIDAVGLDDTDLADVTVHFHNTVGCFDMTHPLACKGQGLQRLVLQGRHLLCFGNDHNDRSMFELADTAVMIGHSSDLAQHADHHIPLDAQVEQRICQYIEAVLASPPTRTQQAS